MSKTIYEVSVINGTYINKNKEKKNRYQQIGAVIDTKNGPMLKLDSTPLVEGGWSGWAYLNAPKPKEDQGFPKDDDIDF